MRHASIVLAFSLALPAVAAPTKEITIQRVAGKSVHPQAQAIASAWTGRSLAVFLRDGRQGGDPSIVGAQQAKDTLLYEWKSTQPVPDSVRFLAEKTLESWGVAVSAQAPSRLDLVLQSLRIDEIPETFGSTYRAEVSLKGDIYDPGGPNTMPGRVFTGIAKKSGPDKRAKLCNEAVTAAVEDALARIMGPLDFVTPNVPGLTPDASDPNAVPPKEMLRELVRLKEAGVGEPVMLGYVRQRRLAAPLSADDILKWKESGLPESVIHAAQEIK
ncbi:MAG TPA: hypothetical protein VJ826_05715 [Candidatus Polarisedimenticolaceae bacterium]|nr:hypothetical protein [Candidatus Polarisedimenticolaceae bacterium]